MKELKWNLEELFINTEAFYSELEAIKAEIEKIKEKYREETLSAESLFSMLEAKWALKERVNNCLIYGSLMYYRDVTSEEIAELKKDAEELNSAFTAELSFIDAKIVALGKEEVERFMEKNVDLNVYRLHIDDIFRKESHMQDEETNKEIKENGDAINVLLKDYNTLLNSIKYGSIEIEGEPIEVTLSNFAKYISSRDRETRRQTYFAVNDAYIESQDEFARILDTIYSHRTQNATLQGYNSVLEKTLFEENIDAQIIDALIAAVHESLPLMRRYLKVKADLLEIAEPHLYDLTVPLDFDAKRSFELDEAVEIVKEALKPLGKEYGDTIDELLDGHIDASLDEKKHQSMTFSWGPYSFLNFREAYGDIKNLAHELGHSLNYRLSQKNLPFIYADSTIFVGETASIVNEILLNRYLYANASSDEERLFYLSKEIENYFTSVFKQTMYTEFEQDLYAQKRTKTLDATELSKRYGDIIKTYYGDNIICDEASFLDWTRLGHLYRWSFYPYKYATGLLIASVVVHALETGTLTIEEYLEFLKSGSCKYSLDLLKILKIDMSKSSVLQEGFEILKADIEKLESLLADVKSGEAQSMKLSPIDKKKDE